MSGFLWFIGGSATAVLCGSMWRSQKQKMLETNPKDVSFGRRSEMRVASFVLRNTGNMLIGISDSLDSKLNDKN